MQITHVAIISSHNGQTYSLPRPNRHHHVLGLMDKDQIPWPITGEQGFLADGTTFVNRQVAYNLAVSSGQCQANSTTCPGTLYSEDLW